LKPLTALPLANRHSYVTVVYASYAKNRDDVRKTNFLKRYVERCRYLVSDLDEQEKNENNKQVVNDADSSDDSVHDLDCRVMDVGEVRRPNTIFRRRGVVPDIAGRRGVLHRCRKHSRPPIAAAAAMRGRKS